MSSIDERVVDMKFNNAQFEAGVKTTMGSLKSLKDGLNMENAKKGLSFLSDIGKNFSVQGMIDGLKNVGLKFVGMSAIAITALTNITNRAIDAGAQIAKSLTIQPIIDGLQEYELKMGSIQTMLANTERYGTTLDEITGSLDALNAYADKTIYNFGDMTRNIGLFTNAGIRIEDATAMIQGFSNVAAASGTSAAGAAGAAYQLSQALSAGTIRLMDWRSLTNVGMGNKNMQLSLIEIAEAMGALNGTGITATQIQEDFNGSLEKNWLSADVMTAYLKIMAGEMDAAAMASLGLTETQIEGLQQQAKTAEEAATKVRTWTQLLGTLQEGVGSSWAQTFDIVIGDFNEATELFTGASDVLGEMINSAGEARNNLLQEWKDLGGRDAAIDAIKNAFQALMSVLTPIKDAFRDIFPATTAEQLVSITEGIRDFMASLKLGTEAGENLRRTFRGVFAVLDIGWMVIKEVFGLFGRLFGLVQDGSGGFLELTGNVGDFLVKVRDAIKDGEGLSAVFDFLGDSIENVVGFLQKLGGHILDWVDVDSFAEAWERVGDALQTVKEFLQPVADWIVEKFTAVKEAVKGAFDGLNPSLLVGGLNAGLFAGLLIALKKFSGNLPDLLKNMFGGIGGGIIDNFKEAISPLTDTLSAMQAKLKAETLMKIAVAIGVLAASVLVLSLIDPKKLATALGAISIMFTQLIFALKGFEKVTTVMSVGKMNGLAASLILLSTGLLIMSAAVANLSRLSWGELARGLTGMAGGLLLMVGASQVLSKQTGSMVSSAVGIVAISGAMLVMAEALEQFAQLSWEDLGKGIAAVAGLMTVMAAFSKVTSKLTGLASAALGMIVISGAMLVLAEAVERFSDFEWEELGKGMATMAVSLGLVAAAMNLMPVSSALSATAVLVISAALLVLSQSLDKFSQMSWEEIAKSMVMLAGSLGILAGAMALMGIPIVLLGSVGILAAATALMALAPAMVMLGGMTWDEIGHGLTVLAAALGIMAAAGILILPAIPGLVLLGTALALIGVGALGVGAGLTLAAGGLVALAGASSLGAGAITIFGEAIIGLIPKAVKALGLGIKEFLKIIAKSGPEFFAAMTTLIMSLLKAIDTTAPKIIDTLVRLLLNLLDKIQSNLPKFVQKGTAIILGLLEGLEKSLPKIISKGTDVAVKFIEGIGKSTQRIVDAGMDMVIDLVNGVANSIRRNTSKMNAAGRNLASAIIDGMTGGIWGGIGSITSAARSVASSALNAAKTFLGINSPSKEFYKVGAWSTEGMANAFDDTAKNVAVSASGVAKTALNTMKSSMSQVADLISSDVELTPSIRPVLDLSSVKRNATQIGDILSPSAIVPAVSYNKAATIAIDSRARQQELAESQFGTQGPSTVFQYNQYNSSPKALSEGEIYRQTKNQISTVKEALPK